MCLINCNVFKKKIREFEKPFQIVRNDLTKMSVDAIVNTTNPKLVFGSGLDKAVYEVARS